MLLAHCLVAVLCFVLFPAVADDGVAAPVQAGRLSGNLSSTGSDSLNSLMQAWSLQFMQHHPELNVQIQASGSATAAVALTESTANLGPMSRPMTHTERLRFERMHGYPPLEIPVALETLAVYVHRNNPLNAIKMNDLESLFSVEPQCRSVRRISRWAELGVAPPLGQRRISLFGRNSASGTYGFLKQQLLCHGDFKPEVHELPGAAAVIQAVALAENGIGIAGARHQSSAVKALQLLRQDQQPMTLQRTLFIYLNAHPVMGLGATELAFMQLVLSDTGQQLAEQHGFEPIPLETRLGLLQRLKELVHVD
ncbi:substrate-binding domain-containing protein [Alkalimonas amylolytica]|uniref:Phosphate ABC transporter substrate-binding protein, PhoT family n=1 Tax=Alkalimonas amylolytica TaxID=152573 RepID=A0A1H4E168_ALKAM|nr:substrate-binding domain-containing protein [Alkalimonas amylolytica]SEA78804.1 phosphate ABC transporter substrate-binding protein, PhoT family [Alkalimonas amylolytica]